MLLSLKLFSKVVDTFANDRLRDEFSDIAHAYESLIRRICFGFARSAEEMEDLRQDSLLNIWQSLPHYKAQSSLKTWIYRITLNTCVSTLRKKPKNTASSDLPDVIDESEERKLQLMLLHDMISRLPPIDKAIILLWLDENSYDDMARIMGLPRNTIATRLRRAKEKLKNIE